MPLGNLFREQGVSSHLPYIALEADDTLLTDKEDRIRTWKVNGLAVDTANNQKLNDALIQRMALFTHLPNGEEFRVHHTLMRTHQQGNCPDKIENPFACRFINDYYAQFNTTPLYNNEHYISLIHRLPTVERKRFEFFLKHKVSKDSYKLRKIKAAQRLEDASKFLEQQLAPYGVKRLGARTNGSNEILGFLSKILNLKELPLRPQPMDLKRYLPKMRLFFGDRVMEIQDPITGQCWYAALLAVKGYDTNKTWPHTIDELLTLPIEFLLTQSFKLTPRHKARDEMSLHQRRLSLSEDPDQQGQEELYEAQGALARGDFAIGNHQLSVMVISQDINQIEDHISTIHHVLLSAGLVPVRDALFMETIYWSQFPGNQQYSFRNIPINSGNMACIASLHTKTSGNKESHWGKPLLLLPTPQKTSYWFNFHTKDRDIGDALVLGEKGSGKTMLLTGMATAALQYNPRIFYFDKDFGAENWVRAVGGNHVILGTGEKTGLNPLQLPDTPKNRSFLSHWLTSLLEAFGNKLTETEHTLVARAIEHNYEDLHFEQRTLSNLQSVFGAGGPGSLKNRLSHWVGRGEYAFYFDNPTDTLKFDNSVTGFEMHYLLQDSQKIPRASVLIYLFHRIRLAMESSDLRPTMLLLDEAIPLLENEYFEKEIQNWLLTNRKMNAITIFGGQNPESFLKCKVGKILIAECVTKIIFRPNTPTPDIYKEGLHLTDGEYDAVCHIRPGSRSFLIKQPDHAIICGFDLSNLPSYLSILSSRPKGRDRMLKLYQENPTHWWEQVIDKKVNIYD